MRGLLDGRTSMGLRGTPPQQAPLEDGDECLRRQGDDGDEDHAGQHPVHVEVVLRRADQQAQALVGAEDLADEGADEGEAEADVQARQDPREGGGEHDVAGHLPAGGAEEAGVGDEVAVDLTGTLEGVEEDAEEDEDDGEDDLRLDAEAEGHGEDRAEDDARDRVGGLEERGEELGDHPDAAEGDAADDAEDGADDEAEYGLLERDEDLVGERPLARADGEPVDEGGPRALGLAPEEGVDDLGVDAQLP